MPTSMLKTLTQIQSIYKELVIAPPTDLLKKLDELKAEPHVGTLGEDGEIEDEDSNVSTPLANKLELFLTTPDVRDNPNKALILYKLYTLLNDPLFAGEQFNDLAAMRAAISAQINALTLARIQAARTSDTIARGMMLLVLEQVLFKPELYAHLQSDTFYALDEYLENSERSDTSWILLSQNEKLLKYRLKALNHLFDAKIRYPDAVRYLARCGVKFNAAELQAMLESIKLVPNSKGLLGSSRVEFYKEIFAALDDEAKTHLLSYDQQLAAMILLAVEKPILPIEDLESMLFNAAYNPSIFSPMLICSVIDHLNAHPEWNNNGLFIRGRSLWVKIGENRFFNVLQHLPCKQSEFVFESINTVEFCRELFLSKIFAAAFDMERFRLNPEGEVAHTIRIVSPYDAPHVRLFKNHYVSYKSMMEFSKSLIMYLMVDTISLEDVTDDLIKPDLRVENKCKVGNFIMDLTYNPKFVTEWQALQSPQSLLCLVRLAAFARVQRLDSIVQNKFEHAIQQSLDIVIANLNKLADGPEQDKTLKDLKTLLDHLYAYYDPWSFEKILFRSAINSLLQNYSVDSDILDKLKIYDDYTGLSLGTVRTLQFCSRKANTLQLKTAHSMQEVVNSELLQNVKDSAKTRLNPQG